MLFGPVDKAKLVEIDFQLPEDGEETKSTLPGVKASSFEAFVISPKWGTKEWKGLIYPSKIKEIDLLYYYAQNFNIIEFNATFFSSPKLDILDRWREKVVHNPNFRFISKVPRTISHIKRLVDVEEDIKHFFETINIFGEHRGPVFAQLSETFGTNNARRIENFLKLIPDHTNFFLELRHEQWFSDAKIKGWVFSLLKKHNVGSIITDTAGRRDCLHMELTKPEAYIRFLAYGKDYLEIDKGRIDQWIDRLLKWKNQGLEKVYFVIHLDDEPKTFIELANYVIEKFNGKLNTNITKLKRHLPMEPFEIELVGTLYTIKPLEDGNFTVYAGANELGTIEPITRDDLSIEWVTADLMGKDFAAQIGELIEEREI